jgi:hypothetical protein
MKENDPTLHKLAQLQYFINQKYGNLLLEDANCRRNYDLQVNTKSEDRMARVDISPPKPSLIGWIS